MNGSSSQVALHLKEARTLENRPREQIFANARQRRNKFLAEARAHEQNQKISAG